MNIIIKKNLFIYKNFKTKCSIGKNGTNKRKFEGDLKTPKGIFKLGKLYYRKDSNNYLVASSSIPSYYAQPLNVNSHAV